MPTTEQKYTVEGKETLVKIGDCLNSLTSLENTFFIVDQNVWGAHETTLVPLLENKPYMLLEAKESLKTLQTAQKMSQWLLEKGANRQSTVVVIGGGVLGDMGGFVAATFMRGISLVQIPTTLLAMVDSSLGGKNGVNSGGKNIIGTIYQPDQVLIDPRFLSTLPEDQVRSGMAEIVKYGCISTPEVLEKLPTIDGETLALCVKAKMDVVVQDPREENLRATLNFGHTVGHAIESATNYTEYSHGEAVAIGMVAESALAASMGMLSQADASSIKQQLDSLSLPTVLPLSVTELINHMRRDKKSSGSGIPFVFPSRIGSMAAKEGQFIHHVDVDTVLGALK